VSPISPEKKALYPADWSEITREVRERDGRRCKWCGKPNRNEVEVASHGRWFDPESWWRDERGELVLTDPDPDEVTVIKVILTVAHLDHDPTNNGVPGCRPNLAALCQRCHLRHDRRQHTENARKTRARRIGQAGLFEEAAHA
jgi:hypothetical protein